MSSETERMERLAKQLEDLLAKLPANYPERFEKVEKLISSFISFFVDWLYITVQMDRERYISITGKERFEELRNAISDFIAEISRLKVK